jgi:hypothetical protein
VKKKPVDWMAVIEILLALSPLIAPLISLLVSRIPQPQPIADARRTGMKKVLVLLIVAAYVLFIFATVYVVKLACKVTG